MQRTGFYFLFMLLIPLHLLCGQAAEGKFSDLGLQTQQYPTGFLVGVHYEFGLSAHHALAFRAGVNIFDHRDLGVQEEETGSGPGFTIGYSYYFKPDHTGWFLGLRSDLWFNSVDWRDRIGTPEEVMEIPVSSYYNRQPLPGICSCYRTNGSLRPAWPSAMK